MPAVLLLTLKPLHGHDKVSKHPEAGLLSTCLLAFRLCLTFQILRTWVRQDKLFLARTGFQIYVMVLHPLQLALQRSSERYEACGIGVQLRAEGSRQTVGEKQNLRRRRGDRGSAHLVVLAVVRAQQQGALLRYGQVAALGEADTTGMESGRGARTALTGVHSCIIAVMAHCPVCEMLYKSSVRGNIELLFGKVTSHERMDSILWLDYASVLRLRRAPLCPAKLQQMDD